MNRIDGLVSSDNIYRIYCYILGEKENGDMTALSKLWDMRGPGDWWRQLSLCQALPILPRPAGAGLTVQRVCWILCFVGNGEERHSSAMLILQRHFLKP